MHHGGYNDVDQDEIDEELDELRKNEVFGYCRNKESAPMFAAPNSSSEIVAYVDYGEDILINLDETTEGFYFGYLSSGIEGYVLQVDVEV